MSRPPPLKAVPNYKSPTFHLSLTPSDADGLTPRTPHSSRSTGRRSPAASRSRRQNQPRAMAELDADDLDEIDLLPSPEKDRQALLGVPNSASSHRRPDQSPRMPPLESPWRGGGNGWGSKVSLVLMCVVGVVIVGLTGVSIFAPELLVDTVAGGSISSATAPPASVPTQPPSVDTASGPLAKAKPQTPSPPSRVISYAKYKTFPLTPQQYAEECWIQFPFKGHGPYWEPSGHGGTADVGKHTTDTRVCTNSITYMLDGTSSGVMAELVILAQVIGFARERKRPFFLIDKDWNRGAWSDFFEAIPSHVSDTDEPGCLPPPPEELAACPRLVNHWLVSFRTAKFHFGHDFFEEFEDPKGRSIQRQKLIYLRAQQSFITSILPNSRVRNLITSARNELLPAPRAPSSLADADTGTKTLEPPAYVGVHIRTGDYHAQDQRYHRQPVPVDVHAKGVQQAIDSLSLHAVSPLTVFAASDSTDALDSLSASAPKAWKIVSLKTSANAELRELVYPETGGYVQADWAGDKGLDWSAEERLKYTTGLVVDFALISGMWPEHLSDGKVPVGPAAVVCGIKSTICTTAALGLGFDRAFAADHSVRWIDVDSNGTVEPLWDPFRLVF